MNEEHIPAHTPETAESHEAAKPAPRRKAPARATRKKAEAAPQPETAADAPEASLAKPQRAPRKAKAKPAQAVMPPTADLFSTLPTEAAPEAESESESESDLPMPAGLAAAIAPLCAALNDWPGDVSVTDAPPHADEAASSLEAAPEVTAAEEAAPDAPAEAEAPVGPRRKRKRRRSKSERPDDSGTQAELPDIGAEAEAADTESATVEPALIADSATVPPEAIEAPAEATPLPPFTVISLGLDQPPTLSADALAALRAARVVLGTGDALDRLAGLQLDVPQQLCGADSAHLDLHHIGQAGSVLVVVGDAAGDGPAAELLAELGPARVRVLPGVGRVQAACAALGISAEIVSVVDLRRSPLAALRGQLRAHRLLAVPVADAGVPGAVARLLVDSGFAGARVWVCEFTGEGLQSKAWLATELADLREPLDPHAVLIVATGPSAGVFPELPGLSEAALGDEASAALPLSARALALAWLQPAAWETGWAIADGEASLALEWARAVPTARVRAVGVEPSLLGVAMARAGVGENLSAVASASPQRCREWPVPEAVFVRGGIGRRLGAPCPRRPAGGHRRGRPRPRRPAQLCRHRARRSLAGAEPRQRPHRRRPAALRPGRPGSPGPVAQAAECLIF